MRYDLPSLDIRQALPVRCNTNDAPTPYSGFQHSMVIAEKVGSLAASASAPERTLVEGGATAATEAKTVSSTGTKPSVTAADLASNSYLYAQIQAKPEETSAAVIWSHYKQSPKHDQIVAASSDVFASLPEFFSSRFKNPCWFRDRTLHCIPYYHILGVSKCGTTDIYNRLIKHPHIYESLNKGPHWWDECPWPLKGACTAPPKGDFDGYINLFSKASICQSIWPSSSTHNFLSPLVTQPVTKAYSTSLKDHPLLSNRLLRASKRTPWGSPARPPPTHLHPLGESTYVAPQ